MQKEIKTGQKKLFATGKSGKEFETVKFFSRQQQRF